MTGLKTVIMKTVRIAHSVTLVLAFMMKTEILKIKKNTRWQRTMGAAKPGHPGAMPKSSRFRVTEIKTAVVYDLA
jgi:hypothetical protein